MCLDHLFLIVERSSFSASCWNRWKANYNRTNERSGANEYDYNRIYAHVL